MVAIANRDGSLFCNVIADDSEYAMSPDGFNQVTIVSSFPMSWSTLALPLPMVTDAFSCPSECSLSSSLSFSVALSMWARASSSIH